jgi:hypothetical protein
MTQVGEAWMPSLCSIETQRTSLRAPGAVGVDVELGHDEQRDAARAGRGAGSAGEHQVDDVLGQVVFAEGDEDLGAGDAVLAGVRAFGDRHGGAAQRAHVGPGLRFGQVHRARPFAADQLGQIERLLGFAAVVIQRLDRADGEHRQQGEAHVGRAQRLENAGRQREGQALSAMIDRPGDRVPALLDERAVGVGEAGGQRYRAIVPFRALGIAQPVERCPFAGGQRADAFHDGFHQIGAGSLEAFVRRQFLDPGADAQGKHLVGGGWREIHRSSPRLVFLGRAWRAL